MNVSPTFIHYYTVNRIHTLIFTKYVVEILNRKAARTMAVKRSDRLTAKSPWFWASRKQAPRNMVLVE